MGPYYVRRTFFCSHRCSVGCMHLTPFSVSWCVTDLLLSRHTTFPRLRLATFSSLIVLYRFRGEIIPARTRSQRQTHTRTHATQMRHAMNERAHHMLTIPNDWRSSYYTRNHRCIHAYLWIDLVFFSLGSFLSLGCNSFNFLRCAGSERGRSNLPLGRQCICCAGSVRNQHLFMPVSARDCRSVSAEFASFASNPKAFVAQARNGVSFFS